MRTKKAIRYGVILLLAAGFNQACEAQNPIQSLISKFHNKGSQPQQISSQSTSAAAEAEAQAALDEYKKKRDPSDVVEQVLNYSATGRENGTDGDNGGGAYYPHWTFFIKESTCVYKIIDYVKRGDDPLEKRSENTVDLTKYDFRLFDFKANREQDDDGDWITNYSVLYDGKRLLPSRQDVSLERLRRGWNLIYTQYCTGIKKAF